MEIKRHPLLVCLMLQLVLEQVEQALVLVEELLEDN